MQRASRRYVGDMGGNSDERQPHRETTGETITRMGSPCGWRWRRKGGYAYGYDDYGAMRLRTRCMSTICAQSASDGAIINGLRIATPDVTFA